MRTVAVVCDKNDPTKLWKLHPIKLKKSDHVHKSSIMFPLYFREASQQRVTFGRLGSQSGKFWHWLRQCPTMDWQTKRSLTTATTSTVKTRSKCGLWNNQLDVLVKSMTSCATVGLKMTQVDQLSTKYICSYSEKMRGIVQIMKNWQQWCEKMRPLNNHFLCRGWTVLIFDCCVHISYSFWITNCDCDDNSHDNDDSDVDKMRMIFVKWWSSVLMIIK